MTSDSTRNQADDAVLKMQIEYWKKIVDVQQHFNDIEMRVRALFLTLVGILLGAAAGLAGFRGDANGSPPNFVLGSPSSLPITFILVVTLVLVLLFWYMDAGWYHIYLRAAASTGGRMEAVIAKRIEVVSLSAAITQASHEPQFGRHRNSSKRLTLFYGAIAYILFCLAVLSHFPIAWLAWSLLIILVLLAYKWWDWGDEPKPR